jgi:hypothetical protein
MSPPATWRLAQVALPGQAWFVIQSLVLGKSNVLGTWRKLALVSDHLL